MDPIVVINPNSTVRISDQIAAAIEPVTPHVPVRVLTSTGGPTAIESDQDVFDAVEPMIDLAQSQQASAFVVACFSDPGVDELRSTVDAPCFGIAECAVLMAMAQARNVGIVSSVDASLGRHERYWRRLGISGRIVSDLPIGRGVLDLEGPEAFADTLSTARAVVAAGAEVVVLGCTGLSHVRSRLELALGVPVVDPCQAAASMALSVLKAKAA
jgi:Asp/Glu/hydantoin racemase